MKPQTQIELLEWRVELLSMIDDLTVKVAGPWPKPEDVVNLHDARVNLRVLSKKIDGHG
jgi:hypothetical protein